MFRKVVVGLSGGVDSAVTAYLLKQRGYQVVGVFMRNWDEFDEFGRCTGEQDLRDAEYACNKLNIDLRQVNYTKEYWNSVFSQFLEDYQNGLTPNPDILCNKHIKFDLFHKHAIKQLKFDAVATGHYAKTSFGPFLNNYRSDGDVRLLIPKDTFKDQTFFLSGIDRSALCQTMFPLGAYLKSEVKEIARKCGLERLAKKKESTGICFVGHRNFRNFIREYIRNKPGDIVDITSDKIIGQHEGIHHWTVGQRCRLHSCLKPYFVARKDPSTNTIYAAAGHDHSALWSNVVLTTSANWLCPDPFQNTNNSLQCAFRFQHTKPLVNCTIRQRMEDNSLEVELAAPLFAITPGQYAVFYKDTECLGSARILASLRSDQHNELKNESIVL